MAINQRSLGTDLQKELINFSLELAVSHGMTGTLALIPYPCNLNAIQIASQYQTGSPNFLLNIQRFIPGTGVTSITFGSTFTFPVYGTSGLLINGISITSNSELLKLAPGDLIQYTCSSAAGAGVCDGIIGCLIVTPVQDKITYFGNLA